MSKTQRELIEDGYAARIEGKPCIAPTTSELDRGAWEQGWRAANNEKLATMIGTCTPARFVSLFPQREADLVWAGALLTEWTPQTKATEMVWGTSGRGNVHLVGVFSALAARGLLLRRTQGRSILYKATEELQAWARAHELYASAIEGSKL